jgi:DNA polymerase
MFIGEAPGRDEDEQGVPFVGRAGKLLTRIIEAIDMTRDEVYIANICKCRPPNNRAPTPEEMEACIPFLHRQIRIVEPRIICLLGATAVKGLLQEKTGITKLRGQFLEWHGILVMPTYHPAYLLRNPNAKRDVWEDVQLVRDTLRGSS